MPKLLRGKAKNLVSSYSRLKIAGIALKISPGPCFNDDPSRDVKNKTKRFQRKRDLVSNDLGKFILKTVKQTFSWLLLRFEPSLWNHYFKTKKLNLIIHHLSKRPIMYSKLIFHH